MILFVRHGKTDANAKKIFTGMVDYPLNETGLAQAREVALLLKEYKIDLAFCSPLKRAKQTMDEIIKFHADTKVVCDERLIERGDLEGLPLDERDDERWDMKNWNNPKFGETMESTYARVEDFLNEVNSKYAGKNILVVAHYGIGRFISCYFNGFPEDGNLKNIRIKNSQLLEFDNSLENHHQNPVDILV